MQGRRVSEDLALYVVNKTRVALSGAFNDNSAVVTYDADMMQPRWSGRSIPGQFRLWQQSDGACAAADQFQSSLSYCSSRSIIRVTQ